MFAHHIPCHIFNWSQNQHKLWKISTNILFGLCHTRLGLFKTTFFVMGLSTAFVMGLLTTFVTSLLTAHFCVKTHHNELHNVAIYIYAHIHVLVHSYILYTCTAKCYFAVFNTFDSICTLYIQTSFVHLLHKRLLLPECYLFTYTFKLITMQFNWKSLLCSLTVSHYCAV